ncbi:MAG: TMEM143 family protein [Cyanobacteria bacterium P01_A01_bin.45]
MTVSDNREAFIPYRRSDIINLCLEDGGLNSADAKKFTDFCQILSAYYHFRFHKTLESIKDNYVPFNPSTDIKSLKELAFTEYDDMEANVVDAFEHILERANYIKLPLSSVKKSLGSTSLIDLKTEVDFDYFDRFICYYRGDSHKTVLIKKLFFWRESKIIDIFERIVLLIKFKDIDYFRRHKIKNKALKFIPGKIYTYYYKNIPKLDIDLLFPNVSTSMNWKDKLLFGIPAIGAAIPLILRVLPNLLLLLAAVLFFLNAESLVASLDVKKYQVRDIMPILVATLSLGMTLGGFAFKQYNSYKNKKIKFQKDVTDTLFFKNIANNDSVFQIFIDLAEEEECKEIILVYYHILVNKSNLTPEQLDLQIENWMEKKLGIQINFDIHGPLNNLAQIKGRIRNDSKSESDLETITSNCEKKMIETSLLSYDKQGYCHVLPLDDAKKVIDYVWDNAFMYNGVDI